MQNPTTEGLSLSMFESQYDVYLLRCGGCHDQLAAFTTM